MLSLSLVLALAGAVPDGVRLQADEATSAATPAVAKSVLDIFVFEDGAPVSDIEVRLGDSPLAKTDTSGGVSTRIPSGRQRLVLVRGAETLVDLDLLTDKGEIVQIIVTLRAGQKPELDIENSGRSSVLAGERLAERAGQVEEKPQEDQPPGALRGTITSIEDQKPVRNARLFFSGTRIETKTDREGNFAVELPAGTYALSVVHPDFSTQTKENIRVIPEREITLTLELTPAGIQLADYVVTAPYVEGSIASTIEAQRETSAVAEVLGAEQMAATGDSDAAEALQRVSGLTIVGGKYVLVRGQPYRYTYTLLNDQPLPSPEPLLRVVPLDLFPTGVLSAIEVEKSFSPDRPAEFGAGLINLQTRGIPEETFISISVSGGYNTESTFTEGLTYSGGRFDALGYDDGTRALPDAVAAATEGGSVNLNDLPEDELNMLGMAFSNNYRVNDQLLPPDFGVTLAGGGSMDIFLDGTLGAVASVKWGTSWREQDRIQRNFALSSEEGLTVRDDLRENRVDFNSDVGGLLTIRADWEKHVWTANTFYAHQTQQRTQRTTGFIRRSNNGEVLSSFLNWIDRTLVVQQLSGSNDFGFVKLDYRGSYSVALRDAPDQREYQYIDPEPIEGNFIVFGNSGMNRQYNTVDDTTLSAMVDATFPILDHEEDWLGLTFKAGFAASSQERESITQIFRWRPQDEGENQADITELDPEILYDPAQTGTTLLFSDFSGASRDDYTGRLDVLAGYAMADLRFSEYFRLVGGVRYETAEMTVTTFQFSPDSDDAEDAGFDQNCGRGNGSDCYFPAISGTWFITEDLQLRGTYAQTTSRPNLNELSDSRFQDPDSGEIFLGETQLRPALINAADARLEWYPTPTESVNIGAFWKDYKDPIERTFIAIGGSDFLGTLRNADSATVFGFEFGGRFEFTHFVDWFDGPDWLENIYVMSNVAILQSEVRVCGGIDTDSSRPLDGQAEYAFNAQTGWAGDEHDLTIAFNLVGPRLWRAGIFEQPNVFLQPVPILDIVWTWRIWDDDTAGTLRLGASNILDPAYVWKQGDETWRRFRRGATFGAGFKISFQ